jgi:hypothetical protein
LKGSFDVARACGGTVITGHVAFRSTLSATDPRRDAQSHQRRVYP